MEPLILYSGWIVAIAEAPLIIFQYTKISSLDKRVSHMEKTIKDVIGVMEKK